MKSSSFLFKKYHKKQFYLLFNLGWLCSNRKVRNTTFTRTKRRMFPGCLCFIIKIPKKNVAVAVKRCSFYSAVHQIWSNNHQFVQISIVVRCLPFYSAIFVLVINMNIKTKFFLSNERSSCLCNSTVWTVLSLMSSG